MDNGIVEMEDVMKPQVLVVDDVKMNLKLAEMILQRRLTADVLLASSGRECLNILHKQRVDLILLDIAMPEMDGIETLQSIRKERFLSDIPVIFLTAASDTMTVVKASEMHPDDYIRKPFKADDLVERVEAILQKQNGFLGI